MSISGIGLSSIESAGGCGGSTAAASTSATDDASALGAAAGDTSALSGPAQLLSQLQALEKSDPAKAKEAMTQLADKIREQAQTVGGQQGAHMSQFADKLDQAAQTGDLSALQPPAGGAPGGQVHGHGHGHHHHHAASSSSSSTDGSSDVAGASDGSDGAQPTSAGRKATQAYQSNMPSPTDMLNQILTQLSATSAAATS
jgi:hypothetical protein